MLHREVRDAVLLVPVVHDDDVGMHELRLARGLFQESLDRGRGAPGAGGDLDRHFPPELDLPGSVDLPHTAVVDLAERSIFTPALEGQRPVSLDPRWLRRAGAST